MVSGRWWRLGREGVGCWCGGGWVRMIWDWGFERAKSLVGKGVLVAESLEVEVEVAGCETH